jgi:beta-phosphoglucomutase-like phosphatase (HAD superfamily)/molybdopterin-guanine dinucleotide biosynthesis protein A
MNIIIPIGGKGERFLNNGYKEPKPCINILGKPMICHVLDNLKLNCKDQIFIIYYNLPDDIFKNVILKKYPFIHFIQIGFQTKGASETIYEGLKQIKSLTCNKKTMLFDCDTFYTEDVISMYRNVEENAVFYTINENEKPIFSYINIDDSGIITDIAEKIKISDNANTGIYCFKDINMLFHYSKFVVENNIIFNNECYTSCIIDQMIKASNIFTGIQLNSKYVFNLGTPEQVNTYINKTNIFLFDLDGTIVLTEHIYFNIWKDILKECDYNLSEELFKNNISGNNDEHVIKKILPHNNISIDKISKTKDELFIKNIEKIQLVDGIETILNEIKMNGHKLSLVTNCNRKVSEKILNITNLTQYFEFIIIGNECNKPKPFPDPYKKAIDLFNSSNEKAIIFEDSKTGLLSAHSVSPKCIVGIETTYSSIELLKYFANITLRNFENFDIQFLLNCNYYENNSIKKYICNSIDIPIDNIDINNTKLKGGFISDVIDINIYTNNATLKCVAKLENTNENFLTKMSNHLDLYNREYYFYNYLSTIVPVNVPKFYGLIKDDNDKKIGILLENINNNQHKLNLNLNNEDIHVSMKVIENIAKMHSTFWNKNINTHFIKDVRKNNDSYCDDFSWCHFITSKWDIFKEKWQHILTKKQLDIAEYICNHFSSIQQKLSDKNLTFCHGDVKSANIFYKINGNSYDPVFIDWQYITLGKGVQDLVFFMIESFDTEKMVIYKKLFKEYYYTLLIQNGVNYSKEDYEEDFINASYYFPFFVAIWFGTLNEDELIDKNFPNEFIIKLFNFYII